MYPSCVHGEISSVLLFKLCISSFTFMNVCFVSLTPLYLIPGGQKRASDRLDQEVQVA